MRCLTTLAAALALVACEPANTTPGSAGAGSPPPAAAPAPSRGAPDASPAAVTSSDACGAGKLAPWIGQRASDAVRADVARATGAATIRWISPGDMVTEDFSAERLNVSLEAGTGAILSARCG